MVMDKLELEKAIKLAKNKGLQPAKVRGTEGVQFTRGKNERLEIISWDEFREILKNRGLAVYESGGWMKIMRKQGKYTY